MVSGLFSLFLYSHPVVAYPVTCGDGKQVTVGDDKKNMPAEDRKAAEANACKSQGSPAPATTNPSAGSSDKKLQCAVLPSSICGAAGEGNLEESGTWGLLKLVLSIMTAGVGVVAVGAIAYAGFLYATAQDSSEQTKKAKDMIKNVAIGIVAFGLMYVALNFLIPGGVFS